MGKTAKIIAFANNKGGSGKTTTCANVGYSLSVLGYKVLLIDGDMQLNLGLCFFDENRILDMSKGERTLFSALKNEEDLSSFITHTEYKNLDFIPSSIEMGRIENELYKKAQKEFVFRNSLKRIVDDKAYDYILVDSPPTAGLWVKNILSAADFVIIPVEASPWGLFGLANMFELIEDIKRINDGLELLGAVITRADKRKKYYKQTKEALDKECSIPLFKSVISADRDVEWSEDSSMPIMAYKKNSRSALEYMKLSKEIHENVSRKGKH